MTEAHMAQVNRRAPALAKGRKHYDKRDKLDDRRARREIRGVMRGERPD